MITLCIPNYYKKNFTFFSLYSMKNKYETIIKKIHEPIVIVQSQKSD